MLKRTVIRIIVPILLFLAIWATLPNWRLWPSRLFARTIRTTEFRSASGDKLTSLFAGLARDRRFDLKTLRAVARREAQSGRCGAGGTPSPWAGLAKLVGFGTAYADEWCFPTGCTSDHYHEGWQPCEGNCLPSGTSYQKAYWDPQNGRRQDGFRLTGREGCVFDPAVIPEGHCPCEDVTCANGLAPDPPPCESCTWDGNCVMPGKRCTNGCCTDYQCPSDQAFCNPDAFIFCQNGQTCSNGCCPPAGPQDCPQDRMCNGVCLDRITCPPLQTAICSTQSGGQIPMCSGSPIVLDPLGEGFHLTSAAQGVRFALGPGAASVQIAWTDPAHSNGWLALDRNGNGSIDDASELFGNSTPQPPSRTPNGYLALAEFDRRENGGNENGKIDPSDAVFRRLRVWVDRNHNGISEPEELLELLRDTGIAGLSLDYVSQPRHDQFGNQFRYQGRVWDRAQRVSPLSYDVFLRIQQ